MKRKQMFNLQQFMDHMPQKDVYYIYVDRKQAGPMSEAEMRKLVSNGTVSPETYVWMPSLNQWTQAQYIPSVNKLLLLAKSAKKISAQSTEQNNSSTIREDLISAICGLGYKNTIATTTADMIIDEHPNISLEDAIKMALRHLSKC